MKLICNECGGKPCVLETEHADSSDLGNFKGCFVAGVPGGADWKKVD